MANFYASIYDILRHEGVGLPGNPDGRVDHPNDPGGATAFGISLRFLKDHNIDIDRDGDIDADDIRHLTKEEAIHLYWDWFWLPMRMDKVQDQMVAGKIFDMGVNMGPVQAYKLVQKALIAAGQNVAVDGLVGPQTMAAINSVDPVALVKLIQQMQSAFYIDLAKNNAKLAVFLNGWLKRASWPNLSTPQPARIG